MLPGGRVMAENGASVLDNADEPYVFLVEEDTGDPRLPGNTVCIQPFQSESIADRHLQRAKAWPSPIAIQLHLPTLLPTLPSPSLEPGLTFTALSCTSTDSGV